MGWWEDMWSGIGNVWQPVANAFSPAPQMVGSPGDTAFLTGRDPAGNSYFDQFMQQTQGNANWARDYFNGLQGQGMSPAAFNQDEFMQRFSRMEPELARMSQDRSSALGQSLEGIAQRQARLGGEAALAAMPGGRNSGAAMAAFGDAYANPFAQAQAQQQQAQLGLYQNLANQAMGQYGSNAQFGANLQQQANAQNSAQAQAMQQALLNYMGLQNQLQGGLAGQAANWWSPTYQAGADPFAGLQQGLSNLSMFLPMAMG